MVAISPELHSRTNTVEVHMTVAGTSREAAVELVKRLEKSPSFRDARITEESQVREKMDPDTVKFQLSALYVPSTTPEAKPQAPENKVAEASGGRNDR